MRLPPLFLNDIALSAYLKLLLLNSFKLPILSGPIEEVSECLLLMVAYGPINSETVVLCANIRMVNTSKVVKPDVHRIISTH